MRRRASGRGVIGVRKWVGAGVMTLLLGWAMAAGCAAAEGSAPERVTVGIYLTDVYDFDLTKGTYLVDFYIWFVWKGTLVPQDFEIVNGYVKEKADEDLEHWWHGQHYIDYAWVNGHVRETTEAAHLPADATKVVSYRCRALCHSALDPMGYPWDQETLSVRIEDPRYDATQLVYVPDKDGSGWVAAPDEAHRLGQVEDWHVGRLNCYVLPTEYHTDFGYDPDRFAGRHAVRPAVYSRFVADLPIYHNGAMPYVKVFVVLYISVAVAFLALFIHPRLPESRFVALVAAVFAAVTSYIFESDRLTPTTGLTLVDRVHLLGMVYIFLAVVESCLSVGLCHIGKEETALRLDRWIWLLLPGTFAVLALLASWMPLYR